MTVSARRALAALRLVLGWMLLWAFLDKLFGFGFATPVGHGWLAGTSPTAGFLLHGTKGPFAAFFQALASSHAVEWLFMGGLLLGGLSFLLGVGLRVSGPLAALLFALMFVASALPPVNNPLFDEHVLELLLALTFAADPSVGDTWGLGAKWKRSALAKRHPWLA